MPRPIVNLDHEHDHPDGYQHYHYSLEDTERGIDLYLTVEVLSAEKMQELLLNPNFVGIQRVYQTDPHTGAMTYGPLIGSEPNANNPDAAMMAFVDHYEEAANALGDL